MMVSPRVLVIIILVASIAVYHMMNVNKNLEKLTKALYQLSSFNNYEENNNITTTTINYNTTVKTELLPATVVPPSARVKYSKKWHQYQLPIITCDPLGRLGNLMGQYATMYALRRHYGATVMLNIKMHKKLVDTFPNLTIPVLKNMLPEAGWIPVSFIGRRYNYAPIEMAATGLLGPKRFVIKEYAFEIQMFNPLRKEILKEFTFAPKLKEKAEAFLSAINNKRKSNGLPDAVYIGFHVRRTDYARHMKILFNGSLPGSAYFNNAMTYYRKKFPERSVFVVSSDDMTFAKNQLQKNNTDVVFSAGTNPSEDMALLACCHHSIITVGSYGFWSAYLTGGEVVYPQLKLDKEYRFSRQMYEQFGLTSFTQLPST